MAGLADLLLYLGQPNPQQQLAAALAGQQQQPGQQPPQAVGPPGSPPSPGGPGPGQQPPAQPQPQAYQSPPDLQAANQQLANPPNIMSLYLQMDQRNRAEDQINRGLALITANHSMPSMRQSIMESLTGGAPDAGQQVGNLMSLYQTQQQMGAMQDMLQHAGDYDTKLSLPPGTARDMIMAGRGSELVSKMEPTDQQRNVAWEHDQFIKGGGTEEQWQKNYLPMIITGGIPGVTADSRQRIQALTKWQNDPANADRPPPGYLTNDQQWGLYQKDLGDAKGSFNGMNQSLGTFIDKLGDVSANPQLDQLTGSLAGVAKGKLGDLSPGSPGYNLHSDLTALGGTAKALASRQGPKGVGQNLALLGSNPDDYTNYGIGDFRNNVIAPKIKIALTAQANAFGAAGRLNEMPGYLQPYLDPMYQPGGDLDPGGGYKPFTASKDLKQLTPQDRHDFQTAVEHYGPKAAIQHLKDNGYDTSALE